MKTCQISICSSELFFAYKEGEEKMKEKKNQQKDKATSKLQIPFKIQYSGGL